MELITLFVYILLAVLSGLIYYVNYRYSYWKYREIPYIEPNYIYGNIKNVGKTIHVIDFLGVVYEKFKKNHSFAGVYFFINPVVVATNLDFVKNVMIRDFSYFTDRETYYDEKNEPLTAHLFNLNNPKWKMLRSKLTPTFTSGKMKFMFNTVVDVAKEFNETLSEMVSKDFNIDMREICGRFTTDVIGTCAFGIECNSLKDPNAEFRVISSGVFSNPKLSRYGRVFVTQFPQIAKFFRFKVLRSEVSEFFMQVVRETVEYREKNNIRRNDFMDLLIQLKNNEKLEDTKGARIGKLTLEEIAAQAFVFFLAGFETSSTTMSFALYELALNPAIQEKARTEINEVLSKHKELTYEAIMEMTYLDQIISETLRKYPVVHTLTRVATRDYPVPNSKHVIEKGTTVIIPAYSIQHDPEIYPEPQKFDPERFCPEMVQNRDPLSFLGFGDGPRNCIGLRFGRMQSRIGLVTLLKNYKFCKSSKTEVPLKFSIKIPVLAPVSGIWLTVEHI